MAKDAAPSLEGQKTPSSASSATGGNTGSSSSGGTDQQQPYSGSVVTLVSMDGDGFVVESSAIMVSKLLDAMLDGKRSICHTVRYVIPYNYSSAAANDVPGMFVPGTRYVLCT